MVRVTVDGRLEAMFAAVDEAELCGPEGQTLGHFLSEEMFQRLAYDWANAQVSDAELERRRQQSGGKRLAEILAGITGR